MPYLGATWLLARARGGPKRGGAGIAVNRTEMASARGFQTSSPKNTNFEQVINFFMKNSKHESCREF
jgi:hypothetical protein